VRLARARFESGSDRFGPARRAPARSAPSGAVRVPCRTTTDARRLVAVALPIVVPVAMRGAFTVSRDRFGEHVGYVAGFGAYWATCAGAAIALSGRAGPRRSFAEVRPRLGRPLTLGAVLLLWPPVGAIATRFVPEIRSADVPMVATIAAVGTVNAVIEELFWRGVYIDLWPDDPWLGWLWPALGFGAWHLAPQVIHRSSMGPVPYVLSATALGLSWGWVAWRTKSLRWVALSHAITDGSGIRNARFFLGT